MIRKAEKRDIAAILELLLQVNDVHAEARPDLFLPGHRKYTPGQLEDILHDPSAPVFVHISGPEDMADGYCFCRFEIHPDGCNITPHISLYIDDLCVDANARGRGVGRKLYNYVKHFAKENSCAYITLNVWEGNDSAASFYRGLGMKVRKTTLEDPLT